MDDVGELPGDPKAGPEPPARSGGWKPAVATASPGPPESTRTVTAPSLPQTRTWPGMMPCRNALAMTSPAATSAIRLSATVRPRMRATSPTRRRATARSPASVSFISRATSPGTGDTGPGWADRYAAGSTYSAFPVTSPPAPTTWGWTRATSASTSGGYRRRSYRHIQGNP